MIEWINLIILIFSIVGTLYFYVKSVQPAKLEQEIGEIAYEKCEYYRKLSTIPMFIIVACYILYVFFPLPFPIPDFLPWDYYISLILAVIIAVPSFYLMIRGARDAGEETMRPRKEHEMYGGIYKTIRHPQALGEVWTTHIIALILHRTFLFLFSFLSIPMFYLMCIAEERDLIIRYGEPYIEYRERVGMFFPKRGKKQVVEAN